MKSCVSLIVFLYFASAIDFDATASCNVGERRSLIVPATIPFVGGLFNQISIIAKGIILGLIFKRQVFISGFSLDYRNPYQSLIRIHNIFNVSEISNRIKNPRFIGSILNASLKSHFLTIKDFRRLITKYPADFILCDGNADHVANSICFSTDNFEDNSTCNGAEIHYTTTLPARSSSNQSAWIKALAGAERKISISPILLYRFLNIGDPTINRVVKNLIFNNIFYEIAHDVLIERFNSMHPISPRFTQTYPPISPSSLDVSAVHLRFENDFIDLLLYQSFSYKWKGSKNFSDIAASRNGGANFGTYGDYKECNTRLMLKMFMDKVKHTIPSSEHVFICGGREGKFMKTALAALEGHYVRHFSAKKQGLFTRNGAWIIGNDILYPAMNDNVNSSREIYALIDFIIASRANHFVGMKGSAFSRAVKQVRFNASETVRKTKLYDPSSVFAVDCGVLDRIVRKGKVTRSS
jgi:hypothetical protein